MGDDVIYTTSKIGMRYVKAKPCVLCREKYRKEGRVFAPNDRWIEMIKVSLNDCGMKAGEVRQASVANGNESVCAIETKGGRSLPGGLKRWIAFINSNDLRRSSALYGGVSDGKISVVFDRVGRADRRTEAAFVRTIEEAVFAYAGRAVAYGPAVHGLQAARVDPVRMDSVILKAMRIRMVNWFDLQRIQYDKRTPVWDVLEQYSRLAQRTMPIATNPIRDQLGSLFRFLSMIRETLT